MQTLWSQKNCLQRWSCKKNYMKQCANLNLHLWNDNSHVDNAKATHYLWSILSGCMSHDSQLLSIVGLPQTHKLPSITTTSSSLTHSQLLKGLKCEFKWKTTEEGGVGARPLTHNTLRGRGACWSSGMGLRRINKLYSFTRACTQPTQSG
jgi:hypothetical protein